MTIEHKSLGTRDSTSPSREQLELMSIPPTNLADVTCPDDLTGPDLDLDLDRCWVCLGDSRETQLEQLCKCPSRLVRLLSCLLSRRSY